MLRAADSSALLLERATSSIRRPIFIARSVYVFAVLGAAALYVRDGSKLSLLLVALLTLGPLAIYVALRSPLVFPLCAYILVLPFDSLSSLGSGGTLAKLLGVLTAGAVLIRVLRPGQALAPPRVIFTWLGLLLWMGISLFWALSPREGLTSFQMYASLIALFVLISAVRVSPAEFNAVLGSVVTAGAISAGYDAYLYHSGQSLVATTTAVVSRVMITAGDAIIDPNALATALVLPSAVALYWLFNSRYAAVRFIMIPVLVILLLGFAASGSRGGFVELGVVFLYLIVRSRHRLWLLGLMVSATITTLAVNPGLPARFAQAQQDGGAGRRDIWHVGLYALRDYWMAGAGVGNFPNAFDREYIHVYAQYVLGWHWAAHNVPLMIATELGVVGFAIFVVAIVGQFLVLNRLAEGNAAEFELRLALEGAFLGIVVSGFSTSDLNAKYVWLAFGLMVLYRGRLLSGAGSRRSAYTAPARAKRSNTPPPMTIPWVLRR